MKWRVFLSRHLLTSIGPITLRTVSTGVAVQEILVVVGEILRRALKRSS